MHISIARRIVFIVCLIPLMSRAAVTVPPLFGDHMVLQRGMQVPIWGKASPGEKVTIEYAGKSATATADDKGEWKAKLPPLKVGDASSLTIASADGTKIVLQDVVVGDVWVASGQSNMDMQVKSANDAEKEIASASDANIRYFGVPHVTALEPTHDIKGAWEICSPKTAGEFSAVGYFFARDIRAKENVPVGIIKNAWGGMPAESFTSEETLKANPDFKPLLDRRAAARGGDAEARKKFEAEKKKWDETYLHKDEGNKGFEQGFARAKIDEDDWKAMDLPRHWEDDGLKIDGAVWFRKTVDVPADWKGKDLELSLGGVDDTDVTYVNGEEVGKTGGQLAVMVARKYAVPAKLVESGKATIAVRVFDMLGDGGFYGPAAVMKLGPKDDDSSKAVALSGAWKYKVEKGFDQAAGTVPPRPAEPPNPLAPHLASNIYNAMVYPVAPYAIKGAIWYQGESNAGRAEQYRTLFPAMIADWRKTWGQDDFPFFFVQLANFGNFKPRVEQPADSAWAELREAQTMTLKSSPNTGMAVIIDVGDTKDIHPKNKQDVGKRLALAAKNLAYGKRTIEYFGPMYESMKVEGNAIRIKLAHADGLIAKGGAPKAFAIAGADQKFVWADAKIDGSDVVVSAKDVKEPVAVRYAWADDPETNLYNAAELPACPFRTDDWKMSTAGAK